MKHVACATAEKSVNNALRVRVKCFVCLFTLIIVLWLKALPELVGTLPSLTVSQPAESGAELYLLRSIEWTTFLSTTYPMALQQANMILRYFLGMFEYLSSFSWSDASWLVQARQGSNSQNDSWKWSRQTWPLSVNQKILPRNTCTFDNSSSYGKHSRRSMSLSQRGDVGWLWMKNPLGLQSIGWVNNLKPNLLY